MNKAASRVSNEMDILEFGEGMADAARALAMRHFRTAVSFENKEDGSPVTVADRAIEATMREMILRAYPADGILGEEQEAVSLESDRVWVIDPIDGTKSFMTGMPTWGVLIATVEDGRPQLGIIDIPATRERWIGMRGQATVLNGETCETSRCTDLAEAVVYTTSPDIFGPGELEKFETVSRMAAIRRFGGDCYAYALLASGHVDAVIEASMKPFDFMALVPVIEGAGGVITDWQGNALNFESNGQIVAAATPELHAKLVQLLND